MPLPPSSKKSATTPHTDGVTLAQAVYEAIYDAILCGELRPGERLVEPVWCERHGVSRTVVRQALHRLAELRMVDIVPNKGAMVACPTPQQTRDIFAARRVVEAGIVRAVAQRITHAELGRLQRRLEAEHAALHAGDHARWVRLAGGFHLALAQLSGNAELERILVELVARCSLIVAMYEVPGDATCEHAEHAQLLECLSLADGEGAARLMERHLHALEARLQMPEAV